MKKNVNFSLLWLSLLMLVAMVVISFYFNLTYHRLQGRYDDALGNLEELSEQLRDKIAEVNETKNELDEKERILIDIVNKLNLTQKKVTSLSDFYTKEKGSREEVEDELEETERERDFWKLNYTQTKQDLQLWQKNYQIKEHELDIASSKIASLETIITEVERDITQEDGADKNLEDVEKKIGSIKGSLSDLEEDVEYVQGESVRSKLEEEIEDLWEWIEKLENEIEDLKENLNEMKDSLDRA